MNYHIKDVGDGCHIDGLRCPNCRHELDFDIMKVSNKQCIDYIHIKLEDLENLKEYRRKYKDITHHKYTKTPENEKIWGVNITD
jgi:hypothetical protein